LVDLPSGYSGSTCGLCGNFNLRADDDLPTAGGPELAAWAGAWRVPEDDDPFCWDRCEGSCPVCEEGERELYGGGGFCGLLTAGPQLGMVVCKEASCKAGERCAVERGVRRCVATSRSVCIATGDPHYTTFDGRRYDFMGTCVYQLAGLCSDDPTLVPFVVTAENNHRGSHVVSFTKEVTLKVYNVSLAFSQEHPQKLKVNGILVDLPFTHDEKIQVYQRGFHGFIKTDFDLVVTFDWYSYARVLLPGSYAGAVCGLCGDADGSPDNDFALPGGGAATAEVQFANSWKVADVPGCSSSCNESCRLCSEAEKRRYSGDKHCGLLLKKRGPLAPCHEEVDPSPFFEDCVFDACLYQGHHDVVCSSIASYVDACQSRGVSVRAWRTAAFCSPVCPPNQHYELTGPPCPPTCRGQVDADPCDPSSSPPVEGCFCDPGFLQSGQQCVPLGQCGCWHGGHYYQLGQEFFSSPDCSQRCRCQEAGEVQCEPGGCGAGEGCRVKGGVPGCHPLECGRCQVLGAVTFSTFDGRLLAFAGNCHYTLAQLSEEAATRLGEPLVPFQVTVEKEQGGEEGPVIKRLVVTVAGVSVAMDRGAAWEVTVAGERHLLPLSLAEGAVTVAQEGLYRILQLRDGGPSILYDGYSFVVISVPGSYRGHLRGLCGNFDGDTTNDSQDAQELGAAYGTLMAGCTHGSPPPSCLLQEEKEEEGPCGLLKDPKGPFGGCHKVVAPWDYLVGCRMEQCVRPGGSSLCQSFQAYAAACQAAGGLLKEWRVATNCQVSCPSNSHYDLCTRSCSQSCAGLSAEIPCSGRCFEGCTCHDGHLFSGHECVPIGHCGCLHHGRYFQIAETTLSPSCHQSCLCQSAGGLWCQPFSCPFGQSCGLKEGTRGCVEQPGRCSLAPATRLATFDGATVTTVASSIYVMATVCDHKQPFWFRLLADVKEGSNDPPAVVALHLFTGRAFVTIRRDKRVWVNGVPARPPLELEGMVAINETQGTLWATREPEVAISLSPSGELSVLVAKELGGHLCGLCGNYDGDVATDLRGPDGSLVANMAAMVKAWRAPDF
ncbi:FCGBP protein, partial [Rhinopomastus cyanomelas]|nr:FCGBP protein [Rhinopomastus cyanomelas]